MVVTSKILADALAGSGGNQSVAEWARPPKNGQHLEGLSRSYIYRLIDSGAIESMSITMPGAKKGVRMIHVPSLRAWLRAQADKFKEAV